MYLMGVICSLTTCEISGIEEGIIHLQNHSARNASGTLDISLNINCIVSDSKLSVSVNYNKYEYQNETVMKFAEAFISKLKEIIRHCEQKEVPELTPSDLTDEDISIEELEYIVGVFSTLN